MLYKGRIILSIIVVVLAGIGLLMNNNWVLPVMMLFLSGLMLLTGIDELQKNKKAIWGYISLAIFVFSLYAAIQLFFTG